MVLWVKPRLESFTGQPLFCFDEFCNAVKFLEIDLGFVLGALYYHCHLPKLTAASKHLSEKPLTLTEYFSFNQAVTLHWYQYWAHFCNLEYVSEYGPKFGKNSQKIPFFWGCVLKHLKGCLGERVCVCVSLLTTTNWLFPAIVKNNVFVAKICKYALYESSEGFCCGARKPANPCHPGVNQKAETLSPAPAPAGPAASKGRCCSDLHCSTSPSSSSSQILHSPKRQI